MSTVVKTIAILDARPGKTDELAELLRGMAPLCREEPGNVVWSVWRDRTDEARFVINELYTDSSAVAMHRETPHYKDYASKISDLADRTVFQLIPDNVA